MILSRTPLRVSLIGGGTDLPSFYENNDYGCVISTAINRYIYIGVNHRFDGKIRLAYSKYELIDNIDDIENDRIQASLRFLDISKGIEIFYISDIPKKMGLGGSSAFTVGLLNALYLYKQEKVFPERLAHEACQIEIDILKNPIGKQDQYATAFGGMNYIKFWDNGTVSLKPILIDESYIQMIIKNLVFIYLGKSHEASYILTDVNQNMKNRMSDFRRLRDIAEQFYKDLMNRNIDNFQEYLKENWDIKKRISTKISNYTIDHLYLKSLKYGAEAGKLLGAGGGGFLMMYVPIEKQEYFKSKMIDYKILKFDIDHYGTQIVYKDKG